MLCKDWKLIQRIVVICWNNIKLKFWITKKLQTPSICFMVNEAYVQFAQISNLNCNFFISFFNWSPIYSTRPLLHPRLTVHCNLTDSWLADFERETELTDDGIHLLAAVFGGKTVLSDITTVSCSTTATPFLLPFFGHFEWRNEDVVYVYLHVRPFCVDEFNDNFPQLLCLTQTDARFGFLVVWIFYLLPTEQCYLLSSLCVNKQYTNG